MRRSRGCRFTSRGQRCAEISRAAIVDPDSEPDSICRRTQTQTHVNPLGHQQPEAPPPTAPSGPPRRASPASDLTMSSSNRRVSATDSSSQRRPTPNRHYDVRSTLTSARRTRSESADYRSCLGPRSGVRQRRHHTSALRREPSPTMRWTGSTMRRLSSIGAAGPEPVRRSDLELGRPGRAGHR